MPESMKKWSALGDYRVGPRIDRHGNATRQHLAQNREGELVMVRAFDGDKTGNRYVNEATYQLGEPVFHTAADVARADGVSFIARPYVDGVDLRAVAAAPASETKTAAACRILLDVARAVEWLTEFRHEVQGVHGLSHRALEARSVLVSTSGETRLINFDWMKAHRDATTAQEATRLPVFVGGSKTVEAPRPSDPKALFQLTLEVFLGKVPLHVIQTTGFAEGSGMPDALRALFVESDDPYDDWQHEKRDMTLLKLVAALEECIDSGHAIERADLGEFVESLGGYVART